jgi:hypothetical protein
MNRHGSGQLLENDRAALCHFRAFRQIGCRNGGNIGDGCGCRLPTKGGPATVCIGRRSAVAVDVYGLDVDEKQRVVVPGVVVQHRVDQPVDDITSIGPLAAVLELVGVDGRVDPRFV